MTDPTAEPDVRRHCMDTLETMNRMRSHFRRDTVDCRQLTTTPNQSVRASFKRFIAALPLARDTCVHAQSTLESSPQLQDIRITRSISEGVHGGREGGCEPVREQQR